MGGQRAVVRGVRGDDDQWRTGMGGATGLDYSAVPVVMDMVGVKGKRRRREVFRDVRVMEKEALRTWRRTGKSDP